MILIDNRKQGPGRPESAEVVAGIKAADGVLLKTEVYGSIVVTEWRHHPHPIPAAYHVFELDRFDDTEQTFGVEQGADALSYHAGLESAIKRREFDRRAVARALRLRQPALAAEPPDEREVDSWEEAARIQETDAACFARERA